MSDQTDLPSAIARAPMLRIAAPFIAGLVLGRSWPLPLWTAWSVLAVAAGAWTFISFRRQVFAARWATGLVLLAVWSSFGVLWQRLHTDAARPDDVAALASNASGWEVKVLEVASTNERRTRAWVEARSAVVHGSMVPAEGRMLLTVMKDSLQADPSPGDRLLVKGHADPIDDRPDPGGFDLRGWAASHDAAHECFAAADHWTLLEKSGGWPGLFQTARDRITAWLHASGLPDRERGLTKALLLGVRDELSHTQNTAFVRSGTVHVLAVSGSHVAIIYIAILFALGFLGKGRRGRLIGGVAVLAALWGYAGLTGFSPSVLRATVMFSLFTLAGMTGQRVDPLNSLAAAAFLLLLWDPTMLPQLGFQLSFLAVLGIIVCYRPIVRLWAAPNKVLEFFWSLLAVSVAAQVFTLPLCLHVFRAFPVWFLPANMVVVGLVTVAVYGGAALVAFHALPVLGPALTVAMKGLLLLLGAAPAFFANLPGAYPAVRIGPWGMAGLYLLLVLIVVWALQHRRWARTAVLALGAVLLFGWGWTARRRNAQRQFVIYDDRDALAFATVQGRTMRVFADSATTWTERNISNHARNAGVDRIIRVDSIPQQIEFGGRRLAFMPVNRSSKWPTMVRNADLAVIHGEGWLDRRALERCAPDSAATWLLASDLRGYPRRAVAEWCDAGGHSLFDMRDAGAYVRP